MKGARKKDKEKIVWIDDGRTVSDMDVEGMRGRDRHVSREERERIKSLRLTKRERRAIFRGGFLNMLPALLAIAAGFALAFLLLRLWLR